MNELVALDPQSLVDRAPEALKRDLYQITREFGFENGRFIAEFPQSYGKHVLEILNSLSRVSDGFTKEEVKRRLERFLSELLPIPAEYDDHSSWVENASRQKQKLFDAVVTDASGSEFHTFEQLLSGGIKKLEHQGREAKVVATAKNYTRIIQPLISASSELYIADRYFPIIGTCSPQDVDRGVELLSNLIKVAEENKRCKWIILLCDFSHEETRSWSDQKKEEKIRETLSAVKKRTGKGTFCKLGFELVRGRDLIDIHERYVFSMKGCISFDKGLVCDGKSRKVCYESRPSLELTLNKLRKYMRRR